MGKIGRNDPCPCGSRKNYKKCHLGEDEAREAGPGVHSLANRLDAGLIEGLRIFAKRRGERWLPEAAELFGIDDPIELELLVPWSFFHFEIEEGATIADAFLRERGQTLGPDDREYLAAQQESWLSIWAVDEVVPGERVVMDDLLTGARRTVLERTASQSLVRHDVVMGRIVDFRGTSTLSGFYPRALPARAGKTVVADLRKAFRKAKASFSAAGLRGEEATLVMIERFRAMVDELDHRPPPRLTNTDGDPFLLTKDRFRCDAKNRDAVLSAFRGLEGADVDPQDAGRVVFTRPDDPKRPKSGTYTVVGTATLSKDVVAVETTSIRRADDLRRALEDACGGMLRHLSRDHSDPAALLTGDPDGGKGKARAASAPSSTTPERDELDRISREMRDRMNHEWLDLEVPALGGRTPREAARSPKWRKELILLLREAEQREARTPPSQRVDVSWMWAELGLEGARSKGR